MSQYRIHSQVSEADSPTAEIYGWSPFTSHRAFFSHLQPAVRGKVAFLDYGPYGGGHFMGPDGEIYAHPASGAYRNDGDPQNSVETWPAGIQNRVGERIRQYAIVNDMYVRQRTNDSNDNKYIPYDNSRENLQVGHMSLRSSMYRARRKINSNVSHMSLSPQAYRARRRIDARVGASGVKYVTEPQPISWIVPELQNAYTLFANSSMTANEKKAALVWVSHMSQNAKSGLKFPKAFIDGEKQKLSAQIRAIPGWEQNAATLTIKGQIFAFMDALVKTVKDTANFTRYAGLGLAILAGTGLLYIGYNRVRQAAGK